MLSHSFTNLKTW